MERVLTDAEQRLLAPFVTDGRIMQIPAKHSKRLLMLDWLAQDFEPGKTYSEAAVNLIIGQRYSDYVTLRRYLIDAEFLDRAEGVYWRCGGSMLV